MGSPMIQFHILGTLDLEDSAGRDLTSILRRPKLLALLGYLAAARPSGFHRRDSLVALLWPELDNAHARSALRQAVHALREALGHEVVRARGEEELGVNDESIRCDTRTFAAALARGEEQEALELYRGDLLAGLHVSDAPDFERWLDLERDFVRRQACEAASAVCDREEAAGNSAGAARWLQRLIDVSPFDEASIRRLMEVLNRIGDRAGAVQAYDDFERRLARDLEVEPSAETRALVQAIRTDPGTSAAPGLTRRSSNQRRLWVRAPPRRSTALIVVALSSLLVGGWLLWHAQPHGRSVAAAGDIKRLAVLPFANLGPPEDEYFADGMTEEIAAELASIDRLRVIGRMSARRYKRTSKTIPEIGTELGVAYVLEGSVRWEHPAHGVARVRVTPRIVSTADGTQLWAQVYDEPLDELFRVQADIAQRVVRALHVTLFEPEGRTLTAIPTANVEAYDYYLRGNDYMSRPLTPAFTHAAAQMYEKAIALDPTFALAYARLSRVYSRMYWLYYDPTQSRLDQAKRTVDRALELQPDLPAAHHSLGSYYWLGYGDYDRALREFTITESLTPHDINLFTARAVLHERQGDFPAAFADFERAHQLDPVAPWVGFNYGEARDFARDFAPADSLYSHVISVSPDWPYPHFLKAMLLLRWKGSTQEARAILESAHAAHADGDDLFVLARLWVDIFDRHYDQALDHLSAVGVPGVSWDQFRFFPRELMMAQVYGLLGRHELERASYDSARAFLSGKMRENPDDPRFHSALGIAYAGLGRKADAIREGLRGVAIMPVEKDSYKGYYREWDLARIYTMVGESNAAVDQLKHLLTIPGHLTPVWLRLDPTWDPLRGHPGFQKLIGT